MRVSVDEFEHVGSGWHVHDGCAAEGNFVAFNGGDDGCATEGQI